MEKVSMSMDGILNLIKKSLEIGHYENAQNILNDIITQLKKTKEKNE